MEITIRPYRQTDEEAVIRLWHECGLVVPQNDPVKDIARKLSFQPELFLVGWQGLQLVATAMAGYEGHRGWINYLAVSPALQRGGIGRRIMDEAEARLRSLGCAKINLQVRTWNTQVIAFYESIGYKRDDVVGMGKRLISDEPQTENGVSEKMFRWKQTFDNVKSHATGAFLGALAFSLFIIWSAGCGGSASSIATKATTPNIQPTAIYGSNTGQMDLYKTGATFTDIHCGTVQFSGPIVPDNNGNFQVTGFYPSNLGIQGTYSGNIQGNTMNLTITASGGGEPPLNYMLTLGVSGQFVAGTCP